MEVRAGGHGIKDDVMSLRCTDVDGVIVINDLVMQVGREHYE